MTFAGFENLTGGTLDDDFVFANGVTIKGKIDGGAGTDVLDFSASAAALTVNLQTKAATTTAGWLNLEQFLGGSGTNTLIGASKVNTWSLTGSGAGNVSGIHFQGFTNLTGGTLADTFDLTSGGDWLGLLDGASGLDTLLAPVGGTYVPSGPNAGTLNGRSFKSVEKRL